MYVQIVEFSLSVILMVSAAIISVSPLNAGYASAAWGVVSLGALSGLLLHWWQSRRSSLVPHPSPLIPLYLALLSQIASATTQALVAINLPSPHFLLHNTPGMGTFYLLLAGGLAFVATWLVLRLGDIGYKWAALLCAGVFSSLLYLRSFAIPEAGPIYGSVFGFSLIAAVKSFSHTNTPHSSRFTPWSMVFLAAIALSSLFSPIPGQSIDYVIRLVALIGLVVVLAYNIKSINDWQIAAWGVFIIAGLVPILLALIKLLSFIKPFGLPDALGYRFHPTEMGGANLIARSILCVVPLSLALNSTFKSNSYSPWKPTFAYLNTKNISVALCKISGMLFYGILTGSAFVMLYTQSWEGFFAWLIALGVYGFLVHWTLILQRWKEWPKQVKSGVALGLAVFLLSFIAVSVKIAPQLNISSYNGRLIHWYGAILTWKDHPLFGGGLGNEIIYTPYADKVHIFVNNQFTYDDPLFGISMDSGNSLQLHSHNNLLEIGAGAGLLGSITFIVLLVSLLTLGFRVWRSNNGKIRLWAGACLAGIIGELAWGILDVLYVIPPFFSFPIWALIGLLIALDGIGQTAIASRKPDDATSKTRDNRLTEFFQVVRSDNGQTSTWSILIRQGLLLILSVLIILLPALTSNRYAAGFLAFQEHRWEAAVSDLEQATRFNPLSSQNYELLAKAYLERNVIDHARVAYQRASEFKRGYSLYLSQLGWIAWLQGDADDAIPYFEQAIQVDPDEIWQRGLHAELALSLLSCSLQIEHCGSTQGQETVEKAIQLFKKTIELEPQTALAPYWHKVQLADGEFDVVLDSVYLNDPSPELNKRILTHLGKADATPRLFIPTPYSLITTPYYVSFNQVLDAVEADYYIAKLANRQEAPLRLAALAEASRLVGLHHRAEKAYLEFQSLKPESAYGFRDLGILYREQGLLAEAQAMLEHAVKISPRDFASRYYLALVYLDREKWNEAQQALDTITRQALVTPFHSHLYDPELYLTLARLHQERGDLVQAAEALHKVAIIRGSPVDHLALADIYRQLGQSQQATLQCIQATKALIHTWPRPLDPLLWKISECLVKDPNFQVSNLKASLGNSPVEIRQILIGHVYRAWGQLNNALRAYQTTAAARPDEGAAHYYLGEAYQALGQLESAEDEYLLAAQLEPFESLPLLELGRMQWSQDNREAALSSFRAAVEVTPGWGQAHMELGNALLALGERGEASTHYQLAQIADDDVDEGVVYDFTMHFTEAEILAPDTDYIHGDYFTVDGKQERVLFMHPDSRAGFKIDLSVFSNLKDPVLTFDIAMSPDSWSMEGDGVTFTIYIVSQEGNHQIFSTYIDPKHNPTEQHWLPHTINLGAYAGQTVTITFETSVGPAGDERYDWAGWGEPRLLNP